jgi:hypothetical protein
MLSDDLNANELIAFHDRSLADWEGCGFESRFDYGLWHWVERNHRCNAVLWTAHESSVEADSQAQRQALSAARQERWEAVSRIDQLQEQWAVMAGEEPLAGTKDSVGAMVDRLSLLALQIFHAGKQTLRRDVGEAHVTRCARELEKLLDERRMLSEALDHLLRQAAGSPDVVRTYRRSNPQLDPLLHPGPAAAL